ncbi:putative membrane protein YccC [Paraburkholderia sp. GAS199]|uniref:FUSC family protein n=1 Tax=Paraburkholderia sp. GAS199 TaxID=3035126 RepID=UPI003D20480C
MNAFFKDLRAELIVYYKDDSPRFVHAFKATLAVVLSMLICMRLELRNPGTSMVSAVIVMVSQQSGMAIARAFYRALGICAGILAGLMLIILFPQQPVLFLAGLSVWVGLFVAGSAYYKNNQSYGFVLSGYAACITTVPEWSNPYDVPINDIQILSEVIIGVATGSLVSTLIFPQKVVSALVKWRGTALVALLPALREAAHEGIRPAPIASYINLLRESVAVEGLRAAAVFEDPEMRLRNDSLMQLDQMYLDVIARIYAVYNSRQATMTLDAAARVPVDRMFDKLVTLASQADPDFLQTEKGLDWLIGNLLELENALQAFFAEKLSAGEGFDPATMRTLEMVEAEVFSAISSLREFCSNCRFTPDPPGVRISLPIVEAIAFMRSAPIRASGAGTLLAGLRATAALAVASLIWLASGWTNGYSIVVGAGITSGFFSLSPTPVRASGQAFVGCCFSVIAAFAFNFFVMPLLGDVTVFAIALGIVIFWGSYVTTFPKYLVFGVIFSVYFCYTLSLTNPPVYDPLYLLDHGFALLLGIGISAVAFFLVVPREDEIMAARDLERIHELLLEAMRSDLDPRDSLQINSAIRDLILRVLAITNVSAAYREKVTSSAFVQFWIASTLVDMRTLAESPGNELPKAWLDAERDWLLAVENYARDKNDAAIQTATVATDRCLEILGVSFASRPPDERAALFRIRASLYSTRAAMSNRLLLS